MKLATLTVFLSAGLLVNLVNTHAAEPPEGPVKVFLLVGQSNMQGKGSLKHLQELTESEPKKFGHLRKDGEWVLRDDVWIHFGSVKKKMEHIRSIFSKSHSGTDKLHLPCYPE